ncbi:vitamin K epoxide reductase family protein [Lentzea sp. BCCO 10_0798]|uniref:Vitamin K epoxide reductase family protein n=1 Tax=Lentzea kristufekii TaxID=3095430 RepID=A0ABU4TZQ0_9PSEU|nr:vitamin K epoxide reductase family protein [Lentzea sp. BCCO 10_0798]MDX8053672.1 vitamin K epoxide reductase family protein [Lentzea sp. BCCO 10_0798]
MTRLLPWLLIAGGGIGLVAAFVLTVEKLALLKDSDYIPTCSINPVLSCGSIMKPEQAEVFGFPNPLLGIAGFAAVGTIGVVLVTGAALPRWCWLGLQAGVTFGVGFVHWLIYQSLYVIGALCPYCMAVWAVMIPIFWYTTLHNLEQGHLPSPRRTTTALASYHSVALILWYLLIAGAVLQAFWFYWTTLVE